MDAAEFDVAVDASQIPDTVVVALRGELDYAACDETAAAILGALASAHEVIADLTHVTFCDSSGLAMFKAADERAQSEGKRLVLRNLLPNVWRIFDITGVSQTLNIEPPTRD